jgi:AcrR family transcriptional regulator
VADVPLDEIAKRAGISRATLFRRIGSRRALDEALRAAGTEPGGRGSVRERAMAAAADLIGEVGLGGLTLDMVATRADCSVQSIHSRFGGRDGLLTAVFDRYSPAPAAEQAIQAADSLEEGVRGLYGAIFDAASARPRLLASYIADAIARPDGLVARHLLEHYLPRTLAAVGAWLEGHVAAGRLRPLPTPVLMQLLAPPMLLHALTRPIVVARTGNALPSRDEVIALFTQIYLRAVAVPRQDTSRTREDSP